MANILFKVNPILQIDDQDCGLSCALMILDYFGISASREEITKSFKVEQKTELNSNPPIMAIDLYIRSKGIDVTCFSYNMFYFDPKADKDLNNMDLISKVDLRTNQGQFKRGSFVHWHSQNIALLKQALVEKIKIEIERPSLDLIDDILFRQKRIVRCDVNTAIWFGYGFDPNGSHSIIVNGIEDDCYIYIDPVKGEFGKTKKEDLLFAIQNRRIVTSLTYFSSYGTNYKD